MVSPTARVSTSLLRMHGSQRSHRLPPLTPGTPNHPERRIEMEAATLVREAFCDFDSYLGLLSWGRGGLNVSSSPPNRCLAQRLRLLRARRLLGMISMVLVDVWVAYMDHHGDGRGFDPPTLKSFCAQIVELHSAT